MVVGSIIGILIGLAMVVWGGKTGVTVSDGQKSTKVYGWGAAVIGLIVIGVSVVGLVKQ